MISRDEVISMAREVGLTCSNWGVFISEQEDGVNTEELERFAEQIAARAYLDGVDSEREMCAMVCEDLVLDHPGRADKTTIQCAAAIRARGQV